MDGALALESAGAFAIVLESIPHRLAGWITERIGIPTIGIGAGPHCDGQVQVIHDIAGWNPNFLPKHAKRFGNVAEEFREGRRGLRGGGARRDVSHRAAQLSHSGLRDGRAAGIAPLDTHWSRKSISVTLPMA